MQEAYAEGDLLIAVHGDRTGQINGLTQMDMGDFRFGFPVFDRVNKHRSPIIGYQGAINMLTELCNKFLDLKDETCEERFFEMMR